METLKNESFYFFKKVLFKEKHQVSFVLGITQVVVFIAFTSSSREATSCLQSKLRAGLSAHTFPLGVGVYSLLPWGEVVSGSCHSLRTHALW